MAEIIQMCLTCGRHKRLQKWDWSNIREKGVPKTEEEGFACLAFIGEGIVVHAVGLSDDGYCEMWTQSTMGQVKPQEAVNKTLEAWDLDGGGSDDSN